MPAARPPLDLAGLIGVAGIGGDAPGIRDFRCGIEQQNVTVEIRNPNGQEAAAEMLIKTPDFKGHIVHGEQLGHLGEGIQRLLRIQPDVQRKTGRRFDK